MIQTNRLAITSLATVIGGVASVPAGEFEITRATIDGGGVTNSAGGDYALFGTIGQPDAGVLSHGDFTLTGGFWFESPPGDCEGDGDVDLNDYGMFQICIAGPQAAITPGCACLDLDHNGSIDIADFAVAQSSFTGS